jgi:hypothetical protein
MRSDGSPIAYGNILQGNIVAQTLPPGSPAALDYCRNPGRLDLVEGRHLKAVVSALAKELPYLPGERQERVLCVLGAVQEELQQRPGRCAECGEVETPLSELCAFCGHAL